MVIDVLRPKPVAMRAGILCAVAASTPGFVVEHAIALHVIVRDANRVYQSSGQPHRCVPPERFLDIHPRPITLARLLQELYCGWKFALRTGDRLRLFQAEVKQRTATALVFARHEIVETVTVEAHD